MGQGMRRFPHGATRGPGPARPGNGFARPPRRPGPQPALRAAAAGEATDLAFLLEVDPGFEAGPAPAAPVVDAASE